MRNFLSAPAAPLQRRLHSDPRLASALLILGVPILAFGAVFGLAAANCAALAGS